MTNRLFIFIALLAFCSLTGSALDNGHYIGVAFDTAGLNDMAFNRPIHEGITQAASTANVKLTVKVCQKEGDEEKVLEELIALGCNPIIGVGFPMVEPITRVALANIDIRFILFDAVVELPNVTNIVFREEEGAFLAGALASRTSRSGIIGFVGGTNVQVIRRFRDGFAQGARHENPDIKVLSEFIGDGVTAFTSPARASTITKKMIESGADIVFHASGYSGLGVIRAAQAAGIHAIGVDYDQSFLAPGTVIGSLIKSIRPIAADIVRKIARNQPIPSTMTLGLAEKGLELTGLDKTDDIPEGTRAKILLLQREIGDKKIIIPVADK